MSLKRPVPSTNPELTKKMRIAIQDIFGGDERKHNAADEVLHQFKPLFDMDMLATNCGTLSNLDLMKTSNS